MKLDYKKTIRVGFAFAIIMVFWTAYDYVVPLLLENTFGLSNSMRGLIMGLDNLLSLFMLPLFGRLSDKSNNKYGRRTPFIVIGTLLSVVLMIFVPISANKQLKEAMSLRQDITQTYVSDYSYTDHEGNTYNAEQIYTMLYEKGEHNSDYCDRAYLESNNIKTLDDYLEIALNAHNEKGEIVNKDYDRFVKTGINNFASYQVQQTITLEKPGTLIAYMLILFFVLMAMSIFRSPAVALMPDVTPKPLRSQANAIISLAGGVGGALAFLIYTIVLSINPTAYVMVFGLVALTMTLLLIGFLMLVNEKKMVKECQELCLEYGISNEEDEIVNADGSDTLSMSETELNNLKKSRFASFMLILASIFMWFMGYNAITSNLSIYITKTLNLSAGLGGLITGISMGISAIAFIPVGYLAVKIGRRNSIMIGFGLAIASFILIFFFASNYRTAVAVLFTAFYLISGFGLIIANVNTFPMVVELSSADTVGRYTGWYYTATMSAQAITPFIAGLIMDKFGNKFLFLYSSVCVVVAIALMAFVKHGDSKAPPPKSKLELLGADD